MKPAPAREHRRPIDTLFSSLAEDQGERAVCIILSGAGSDGTLGLRSIKEHGGFSLAQAEFDETALAGMPKSAAATGLVDFVMPVEKMPEKLLQYRQHLDDVSERKGGDGSRADVEERLGEICGVIHRYLGHDFTQYKSKTLVRRVQRRMQLLQIDDVPDILIGCARRHTSARCDRRRRDRSVPISRSVRLAPLHLLPARRASRAVTRTFDGSDFEPQAGAIAPVRGRTWVYPPMNQGDESGKSPDVSGRPNLLDAPVPTREHQHQQRSKNYA